MPDSPLPVLQTSSACDWGKKMASELRRKNYAFRNETRSSGDTPRLCNERRCIVGFVDVPRDEPGLAAYVDRYCADAQRRSNCEPR